MNEIGRRLTVEPSELATSLARNRVTDCEYPDGCLVIRCNNVILPRSNFDKLRSVNRAKTIENSIRPVWLFFWRRLVPVTLRAERNTRVAVWRYGWSCGRRRGRCRGRI